MGQIKIDTKYFENIYPPQLTNFTNCVKEENGHYIVPFVDKQLELVRDQTKKKYVAISMFCGAGGLDIGAYLSGIDILFATDINEDCIKTLDLNKNIFGNSMHQCVDIQNLDYKLIESLLKKASYDKFFVIGGPPCQPFSKAGYWVKNENRDSFSDSRNMIPSYFEVISNLKPDGIVLENVESILHPSNKEAVDYIESQFKSLGYSFNVLKLNAAEYGVPQKRKRVFFIATKQTIDLSLLPTHSDKNKGLSPKRTYLKSIIDRPEWKSVNSDTVNETETFEPDIISFEENNLAIYDAKYYTTSFDSDGKIKNVPGVESLAKQIIYELAYRDFAEENGMIISKNSYLMPTEGATDYVLGSGSIELFKNHTLGNINDITIEMIADRAAFIQYLRS